MGIEAIYALFGWMDGTFEFKESSFERDRAVTQNRMEIVLDALRMLDDGLIEKIGPLQTEEAPPGDSDEESDGKISDSLPVIKGPFVDFAHIIEEERFQKGENI